MLDFNSKRILILGGANLHIKLVKAAKEMGLYTIVTDYLENSPAKIIADESWQLDIKSIAEIVERCKREHVDAVLGPFLDPCARPYYEICHELGVPCYIDNWEQVYRLSDKNAFKKMCLQNNVDVIPSYSKDDISDIEYPVLIKPSNSRGAKGQTVCFCKEDLIRGIEKARADINDGEIVIEKFMEGHDEFGAQYLVLDGTPHLLWTMDRNPGKREDGLERVSRGNSYPSYYTKYYRRYVNDRVVGMLKNLGIHDGPVMLQGFIDKNTVRFFDMGFRFGGSEFSTLFASYFGINYIKMLIEFSVTGIMNNKYAKIYDGIEQLNGHAGISLFPVLREGRICRIDGLDEVLSIRGVHSYTLRNHVGDTVLKTGDVSQRLAEIIIYGETLTDLKNSIRCVLQTLKPLDENGNNMLYRNLDPEELKELI